MAQKQSRGPRVWPVFVAYLTATLLGLPAAAALAAVLFASYLHDHPGATAGATAEGVRDRLATAPAYLFNTASSAISFFAVTWAVRRRAPGGWRALVSRRGPLGPGELAAAAAFVACLSVTYARACEVFDVDRGALLSRFNTAFATTSWPLLVAAYAVVGVGAGLAEELFFRGYMQSKLTRRWGPGVSIVVTSACFGATHVDPVWVGFATLVGLSLGWLTWAAGSVRPAMVAHVANNLVAVTLIRALPTDDTSRRVSTALAAASALALFPLALYLYSRSHRWHAAGASRLARVALATPPPVAPVAEPSHATSSADAKANETATPPPSTSDPRVQAAPFLSGDDG